MFDPIGLPAYTSFERIGVGGFSTVYRARQDRFHRDVAIKVLHATMGEDQARRRFLRECAIAGSVSRHPHCVTLLDAGLTAEDQPFIVFEHMGGGSLADRLGDQGRLSVADVLAHGIKLCGALATVHGEGILHRDIKPLNVLISDFGEPCLTDFGISVAQRGPASASMTNSLTPLFTAPEVLDGGTSTETSDIYALGSTLFTLLTGRAPYEPWPGEGMRQALARVFEQPVPPMRRTDVGDEIEAVIAWALARQPGDRCPTALAFGRALEGEQRRSGLGSNRMVVLAPRNGGGDRSAPSTILGAEEPELDVVLRTASRPTAGSGSIVTPGGKIEISVPPDDRRTTR